jgi:hypothetical protein|tara:strand:+ start:4900 stop:6354 length:1455 start_codon:yes stop_codon:yes gene_type:complete
MAMSQQGKNISVVKTFYNDSQMTDMNSLANALMSKPTELSPIITHLAGKDDKRFPLSFLTEGVGNVKSMDRLEYEYRVSTHKRKTRPVATTNSGGNLGQAGGTFTLEFPDKWFVFPYVLVNSAGELARIMKEPEAAAGTGNWKYTLQLVNPSTSATLSSGFTAGDLWAQLYAPVGVDFSRGNASNWETPALVRNKIGTVRKSYHMSGHARDYVVEFGLPTKGGATTKLWMDYEEYQHMLNFKEECEMFYWYGQKTYNSDGHTFMKDENGQPVIVGPGLLEQIVNKDSYSTMTETKIKNIIGDLFYGMTDANKKQVTLYTGTGGMREFDEALKNHFTTAAGSWKVGGENRFITGSGRSLGLSGYFTSYEHVDGHSVNVVKLPLFDHGPVAQAAGKHPVTGYSLESYRMVFVDQSNYDGQANLQMLSKKGREMMRWCVAGSVVPRGFDGGSARASDVDGASVHMLKTAGIILKRFDTSLDITCTAS